ncbi:MAG: hypothetical protein MUC54_09080 [Chloroflexi bacterium]|jgi:hypothetical protein|nr:hypothetical protein [Chloroflexota bacterium]
MRLPRDHRQRPVTLVWLDSDEAIILRSGPGTAEAERLAPRRVRSDVPPHHRATGRVHHDPRVRSGGGADPDDLTERRREHLLAAYLRDVMALVPPGDDVVVLGPGPVHGRLAGQLRAADLRHRRDRSVEASATSALTDRQLRARLLEIVGEAPERRLPAGAAGRRE